MFNYIRVPDGIKAKEEKYFPQISQISADWKKGARRKRIPVSRRF
jgi:hypothetical protein